jgi:hypothetical protein
MLFYEQFAALDELAASCKGNLLVREPELRIHDES